MRRLMVLYLLLLLYRLNLVCGMGYMTTIAAMWLSNEPKPGDYAVCTLEQPSLTANCASTFEPTRVQPPAGTAFYAISGGGLFTCGLDYSNRFPICWGNNESQVSSEFREVQYADLNAGGSHACGVRQGSDQVDCWGNNEQGQTTPPQNQDFYQVTLGDWYTCGLSRSSSQATCWGRITNGKVTVALPANARFDNIFGGRIHVCGLEQGTGKTLCWGSNDRRQCELPEGVRFRVITGGLFHSCGLKVDTHEAVCWGDNSLSQLKAPEGVAFSNIAAGDWYTCGVTMLQGDVRCWGSYNGTLSNIKTNRGLCSKSCGDSQYADSGGACPSNDDKVCLDCSREPCPGGMQPASACNATSDRICSLTMNTPHAGSPSSSSKAVAAAAIGGSLAIVAAVAAAALVLCRKRRSRGRSRTGPSHRIDWDDIANRVVSFTSLELRAATSNYNEGMVLGRGSFGVVYKGILPDAQAVAIKKSSKGESSTFDKELELLARVNHVNLVNLVGYCKAERLLVFEFMENGSLYDCLFKRDMDIKLGTVRRVKVALQAARGIEYLHEYCSPSIIHRDIKTSNVLLDKNWNAHVSDFGLSLFGPAAGETHLSNVSVMGTPGFLDPEYFQTLQLTNKSDVYSFGVVVLELITGRKAVLSKGFEEGIVPWVAGLVEEGRSADAVLDLSVREDFVMSEDGRGLLEQLLHLALQCTRLQGRDRPDMSSVARRLQEILEALQGLSNCRDPLEQGSSSGSSSVFKSSSEM